MPVTGPSLTSCGHCAESGRLGLRAYVLSTGGGTGRDAFFDAVRRPLPLAPPLMSSRSWDALSDSLWEGIYSLPGNRVVILWEDGDRFKVAAPEDFEVALSILADLVRQLADPGLSQLFRSANGEVLAASTRASSGF
jgi:hypothetical protein